EPPNHLDLNETRLLKDFGANLRGFFRVSCQTLDGIAELREVIRKTVAGLPHVFDELPESYFNVKGKLEEKARKENYIDEVAYHRLCSRNGLKDEKDQDLLLRLLHDLGVVLNF